MVEVTEADRHVSVRRLALEFTVAVDRAKCLAEEIAHTLDDLDRHTKGEVQADDAP